MENLIIMRGGKFWSGSRWASEYPEAEVFTTWNYASKVLGKLQDKDLSEEQISLVRDYGLESEIVYS